MRRYGDRRRANRRARRAAAITGLIAAVAGCGTVDDSTTPDAAGTTYPTAAAASSPAGLPSSVAAVGAAPLIYRGPAKGCAGVDTSALDQVLGTAKFRHETVKKSEFLAHATCSVTYGSHVLNVQIDITHVGTGEIMYQGLRAVQAKQGPVRDLSGVGSGAYTYTDPATGPHVVAWNGNLYISAGLAPLTRSGEQGTDQLPSLMTATLEKMRP